MSDGELLYENRLCSQADLADFLFEGQPLTSFPAGRLRLENGLDPREGQAANYVLWCRQVFPADIVVRWRFRPIREPGLAMFWFAAAGARGQDLFSPDLAPRTGEYRQYHSGDINAHHLAYFRRKNAVGERSFHTVNLRKSAGFHLVARGADPIPSVIDVLDDFQLELSFIGGRVRFRINDLLILDWQDDGAIGGPPLGGGRIGFRQMAPLIAEYARLTVHAAQTG